MSNLVDIPGIIARTPTKDSVGSPRDMAFATVFHLRSMQSSYSQHKRICKYMCRSLRHYQLQPEKSSLSASAHTDSAPDRFRILLESLLAPNRPLLDLPTTGLPFSRGSQRVRHLHVHCHTAEASNETLQNPSTPLYIWSRSLWKVTERFVSLALLNCLALVDRHRSQKRLTISPGGRCYVISARCWRHCAPRCIKHLSPSGTLHSEVCWTLNQNIQRASTKPTTQQK